MRSISHRSKPIVLSLLAACAAAAIASPCLSSPDLGSNVPTSGKWGQPHFMHRQAAFRPAEPTGSPNSEPVADNSFAGGKNQSTSGGAASTSSQPNTPRITLSQYNQDIAKDPNGAPPWVHNSFAGGVNSSSTSLSSGLTNPSNSVAFSGPSTGGGGEASSGGITQGSSMTIEGLQEAPGGDSVEMPDASVTTDPVTAAVIQRDGEATGATKPNVKRKHPSMSSEHVIQSKAQSSQQKMENTPGQSSGQEKTNQNAQKEQGADNLAAMERYHAAAAIEFVRSFVPNFTTEGGNKWNKIRNQLFLPMALLLLLPGAVLCQLKSTVSQGFAVLGEISPFEGIFRSIIAIFLIPATYLIVNYSIDTANSITLSIAQEYRKIFGTSMYADAFCGHIRAFPIRLPEENYGMIVNVETKMFNYFGTSPLARLEGRTLAIKYEDPCAGIYIVPEDRSDEIVPYLVNEERMAFNQVNAAFTCAWTILCAAQECYLYYLWFVGPIMAALWVYPSKQLRDAFPSWIEGVVSVCMWSLFWNTTILLMACFRGVDDTGTIMFTALNFLAIGSVKFAFDFSGLVKDAGSQAVRVGEKAAAAAAAAAKKGAEGGGKESGGSPGGEKKQDGASPPPPGAAPTRPPTELTSASASPRLDSATTVPTERIQPPPTTVTPTSTASSDVTAAGTPFGQLGSHFLGSSLHAINAMHHGPGHAALGLAMAAGLAAIPLTTGLASLGGFGGTGADGDDGANLPPDDQLALDNANAGALNGVSAVASMSSLSAPEQEAARTAAQQMQAAHAQQTHAQMVQMANERHALQHGPGGGTTEQREAMAARQHAQLLAGLSDRAQAFQTAHGQPPGVDPSNMQAQQAQAQIGTQADAATNATMSGFYSQLTTPGSDGSPAFMSKESASQIFDTDHNYSIVAGSTGNTGFDSISSVSAVIPAQTLNGIPLTPESSLAAQALNGQAMPLTGQLPPSYDQSNNYLAQNAAGNPANFSTMSGLTGNDTTTISQISGNPTQAELQRLANDIGSAPTVLGATSTGIGDPNQRISAEQYASASPGTTAGYSTMANPLAPDQSGIAPPSLPGANSFGGDGSPMFARNGNIVGDQIASNYQQFNNDVANVGALQAANQVQGAVEGNLSQAKMSLGENVVGTPQALTANTDYAASGGGNAIQQPGAPQQASGDAFARGSNEGHSYRDNSLAERELTNLANQIGSAPDVIAPAGSGLNQTGSSSGGSGSSGGEYLASSSPSSNPTSYSSMPSNASVADQSGGMAASSQPSGSLFGADGNASGGSQTFANNSNIVGDQIASNYQQFDQDVANVGAQQAADVVRNSYGGTEYLANESLGERVGGTPQSLATNSESASSGGDYAVQQPGLPQQPDSNDSFARNSNDSPSFADNSMVRKELTNLANDIGSAPAILGAAGAIAGGIAGGTAGGTHLSRNTVPSADHVRIPSADALPTNRPQAAPPSGIPPMMVPQGEVRQYLINRLSKSARPSGGPGVSPGGSTGSKQTASSKPVRPQTSNAGRPMPSTPPVTPSSSAGKQTSPPINDWTNHLASETLKRRSRTVQKKNADEQQADMESLQKMQKPENGGWTI